MVIFMWIFMLIAAAALLGVGGAVGSGAFALSVYLQREFGSLTNGKKAAFICAAAVVWLISAALIVGGIFVICLMVYSIHGLFTL